MSPTRRSSEKSTSEKTARPNILWICTDQQRFDTIGAMGNPHIRTPNLDRIVRRGVSFTRAYSQSPTCSPSRACMLTGRYPRVNRVTRNGGAYFPRDEVLVTRILADRGYDCGMVGKLHLSAAQDVVEKRPDDGYRVFRYSHHARPQMTPLNMYQDWLEAQGVDWEQAYRGTAGGIDPAYHQTTWCAEEAIRFMSEERDGPWLMSVNIFDPHAPFDPPEEYRRRYRAEDMPLPPYDEGEMRSKPRHQRLDAEQGGQDGEAPLYRSLTDLEKKRYVADYYAMIELIDDQVGRMLSALEESGQADRTLVLFMSDHGDMLWDHGFILKGAYFYEQLLHVPLLALWPGRLPEGLRVTGLVELVDIAPTLLDAAGIEVPGFMQGESFFPLLCGRAPADRRKGHVYAEFHDALLGIHAGVYGTMYRDERYKVVVYHGDPVGELYDLAVDPGEHRNLWDHPDFVPLRHEYVKRCFDASMLKIDPKPEKIKRF